jgi:hypothetical protein
LVVSSKLIFQVSKLAETLGHVLHVFAEFAFEACNLALEFLELFLMARDTLFHLLLNSGKWTIVIIRVVQLSRSA